MAPRIDERSIAGMLTALTLGLALWVVYGVLRGDWVIVFANVIGATLGAIILACKIRDRK
jgi:MtN3 and saliva related transmembrane protein